MYLIDIKISLQQNSTYWWAALDDFLEKFENLEFSHYTLFHKEMEVFFNMAGKCFDEFEIVKFSKIMYPVRRMNKRLYVATILFLLWKSHPRGGLGVDSTLRRDLCIILRPENFNVLSSLFSDEVEIFYFLNKHLTNILNHDDFSAFGDGRSWENVISKKQSSIKGKESLFYSVLLINLKNKGLSLERFIENHHYEIYKSLENKIEFLKNCENKG